MKSILSTLVLATALVGAVHAETFTHQEAKIEITVPEGWKSKSEGETLEVSAPDGSQHLTFILTPAGKEETVTEALDHLLEKVVGKVDWEEKPEKESVNGMDAEVWEGTATKDGKKIEVEASYLDTPAERGLVVYWLSEPGSDKKYEKDIETIVKGLKPLK